MNQKLLMHAAPISILALISYLTKTQKYAAFSLFYQWAVFALHAYPNNSEKLYDAAGTSNHVLNSILSAVLSSDLKNQSIRDRVNSFLIVIWGTRLFTFLVNRINIDGKDSRFDKIKAGGFLSFSIPFTIQALWAYLVDLPVIIGNNQIHELQKEDTSIDHTKEVNIIDIAGWSLFTVGFLLEFVADVQKSAFKADPSNKHKFITSGLWSLSRHPNHFGEILIWLGITLSSFNSFNLRSNPFNAFGLLSPIFTAFIVLGVSGVPMLEKAGLERWGKDPQYQHYIKHTSLVVPWFPAPAFPNKSS